MAKTDVKEAVYYDGIQERYNEAEALLRSHIGALAQPKDWKTFVGVALNIDEDVHELLYDEELVDAYYNQSESIPEGIAFEDMTDWKALEKQLKDYIRRNRRELGI